MGRGKNPCSTETDRPFPRARRTHQAEGLVSGAPSRSLPARLRRAAAFCGLGARFEADLAGGSRERRKTLEAAAVEAGRRKKDPRIEEAERREAFNAVRVQKPLAEAALKREFEPA